MPRDLQAATSCGCCLCLLSTTTVLRAARCRGQRPSCLRCRSGLVEVAPSSLAAPAWHRAGDDGLAADLIVVKAEVTRDGSALEGSGEHRHAVVANLVAGRPRTPVQRLPQAEERAVIPSSPIWFASGRVSSFGSALLPTYEKACIPHDLVVSEVETHWQRLLNSDREILNMCVCNVLN